MNFSKGSIFLLVTFLSLNGELTAQVNPEQQLEFWASLSPDSAAAPLENFIKQKNRPDIQVQALMLAAQVQMRLSDNVLAEHYTRQALDLVKNNNRNSEAQAIRRLGKIYQLTLRYSEGRALMQQALSLFKKVGDKDNEISTSIDLIEFYRAAADPEMAWRLYENMRPALQVGKLNSEQAARLLHRAAAASADGKLNDSVVSLSLQSLRISEKFKLFDHMATSYNELGHYYRANKDYQKSLKYLSKAEKVFSELGYKDEQRMVLRNQVMLYTEMGDLQKAKSVLLRLSHFPQRPTIFKNSYDYSLLESELWRAEGDYKKAFASANEARIRHGEFNRQLHSRQVDELSAKYRTALAEQRALEEKEAKLVASEEAARNRLQRNAAYVIGLIALMFTILLVFAYQANRKKKMQVEEQNRAIDEINKLLSDSLKGQESLYNELHHRVKNNLSVLSSLLYLQSENSTGKVKQALSQTYSRVEALAMLHRQLISKGQIQEDVNLSEYILDLANHLHASFVRIGLDVKYEIDCKQIHLPASLVTSIGLVLNELFTNSYKHAFIGKTTGEIKLLCYRENNLLHLLYRDSGNEIPKERLDNGHSLGLSIINLLISQHDGEFSYFRENGFSCFELLFTINDVNTISLNEKVADYRR